VAAQGKTAVLFLNGGEVSEFAPGTRDALSKHYFLPAPTLQAHLAKAGIVWTAEQFSTKLTLDYLKQFNAVVMMDFPIIENHEPVKAEVRAAEALLARYVAEGGGLLLIGAGNAMWGLERDTEELNRFLAPFGATVRSEQVIEKNGALTLPSAGAGAMAWTGNVVKGPLTTGVRGLLYPTDFAWSYYTHPLQVGADWQVLVKGTATADTVTMKLGTGDATRRPGTAPAEPPLLAVRSNGKGRLALWPSISSPYIIDAYHLFWGGAAVMDGANAALPSDGRALLFNLLAWLAAPSQGTFGGYVNTPKDTVENTDIRNAPVNWDNIPLPSGKGMPNAYRGLIGLRSTLSTGAAAPEAMIQAAKDAGYQFAAFAEDLDKLTAAKFTALKTLCAAQSSDAFQVFPGFVYRDESGNRWLTFGRTLDWPKDDWWSTTAKGAIVKNNLVFRGFAYPPVIMLQASANPEPGWAQGNFKGMALFTTDGGKLVDNASKLYMRLQDMGFDLFPTVVHLVRSPAEVKTAAGLPYQTYTRWWDLPDVASPYYGTFAMRQGSYVFHRPQFVSAGPIIEEFQVYNFGTADLAQPNNDRFRIYLNLTAAKGLKAVEIYDGQTLYRRLLLNGAAAWSGVIEGYHDQNRNFLAIVTDAAGGQAISGVRWTNQQEVGLYRCSDNLNTYPGGKYLGVNVHPLRGLESYIDRQAGNFYYFPQLFIPETERMAVEQQLPVVSRFGFIRNDVQAYNYPATASANWNATDQAALAQPQTAISGRTRLTLFAPRADGTFLYLVEGDFTALRDIDLPRGNISIMQAPWIKDAEVVYLSRRNAPGFCARLSPRNPYANGAMDDVEYVANLAPPGGARAIVPLGSGYSYASICGATGLTYLGLNLEVPGKKLAKGQSFTYRYLAVFGTVNGAPDTGFIEDVVNGLGLRGTPGYVLKPTHGRILDTKGILRLQAVDGGFAGTIAQAKLPIDLPVFIEGLNPRWPAGILYKGKNTLFTPIWRFSPVADRYVERAPTPGENQLIRFGLDGTTGIVQIDTEIGAKNIYIGNLLVCNNPDVFLGLDDARPGKAAISANNPTDAPVTVTIRPGPGFDLLGAFSKTVTIPAGGLVKLAL
jgi:hypothetical protein